MLTVHFRTGLERTLDGFAKTADRNGEGWQVKLKCVLLSVATTMVALPVT